MVPNKARQWLGTDYETTSTMLERAHFTWVGPYCPPLERTKDKQFLRRSESLVRKMGYEFQLTELRHAAEGTAGDAMNISLRGQNNGVAPFYYPWSVEWALLDSTNTVVAIEKTKWDVRSWQPGEFAEKAKVVFDVRAGEYRLALGIRDPWKNRPAIKFANQVEVVAGWTVQSKLKIAQ